MGLVRWGVGCEGGEKGFSGIREKDKMESGTRFGGEGDCSLDDMI